LALWQAGASAFVEVCIAWTMMMPLFAKKEKKKKRVSVKNYLIIYDI